MCMVNHDARVRYHKHYFSYMCSSAAGVPRSLQHVSSLSLEDAQNQSLTLTAFPDPFFLSTLTPNSILRDDPLHAYKRLQQVW